MAVRSWAVVGVLMVRRGRRVSVCARVPGGVLADVCEATELVRPFQQRRDAPTDRRSQAALQLPRRRVLLALRLRCAMDRQPLGRIRGRYSRCPRVDYLASRSESRLCSWMEFSTTGVCEDVSATQNARTVRVMSACGHENYHKEFRPPDGRGVGLNRGEPAGVFTSPAVRRVPRLTSNGRTASRR